MICLAAATQRVIGFDDQFDVMYLCVAYASNAQESFQLYPQNIHFEFCSLCSIRILLNIRCYCIFFDFIFNMIINNKKIFKMEVFTRLMSNEQKMSHLDCARGSFLYSMKMQTTINIYGIEQSSNHLMTAQKTCSMVLQLSHQNQHKYTRTHSFHAYIQVFQNRFTSMQANQAT